MFQAEHQIVVLIIAFTLCLLLLSVFFFLLTEKYRRILQKRQTEALNNLIIGQDNERERISRDLHDQIGPQISAIAIMASGIKAVDQSGQDTVKEVAAELKQVQKEVRNISHDLMSSSLIKYGLLNAIYKLIERNAFPGLKIELESNSKSENLNERQISHLFSVVRELLMNTFKHAGATEVHIVFKFNEPPGKLVLEYTDNGRGYNGGSQEADGIGISNIKTRVRLMNGTCDIDMNQGFKAKIEIEL